LLDDHPRTASIHAETDVVCWVLLRNGLRALSPQAPGVQLKLTESIARDLASRLRRADSEIAALAR
jgi:sulfate permease, SulP family